MKKLFAAAITAVLTAGLLLTGCSGGKQTSSTTDDSWDKIKKKGEFVVGLDDAFPPMGFKDKDGTIVGFDIDLAKEAAKRMGVNVKFQPVNWDTVTLELKNKNIDLIWNGMTITEKRKQEINFTKPYIEDKQILVVAKGASIKGKADLSGKKVGLQSGSSSKEALEKDKATLSSIKEVVEFPNNNDVLMALKMGSVEAAVVDEVVGRYYIAKDSDSFVVLEDHFGLEEFGVGIRKEDTAFLNELQKTLDEMKKDGTSAEISKKWFGADIVK
ncbi:MAG: amino acid ABC transporter substrate-binding protein [Clostridia bacterium]|nr:amino acid ABC transporter substrate-binding protein [Clostridia bacterium]